MQFQDCHQNWEDEIKYVPSCDNPADCLTKPITVEELAAWHDGAACEFLKAKEEFWPQNLDRGDFDTQPMKTLLEEKPSTTSKTRKKCKRRIIATGSDTFNDGLEKNMNLSLNKSDTVIAEEPGVQIGDAFSS